MLNKKAQLIILITSLFVLILITGLFVAYKNGRIRPQASEIIETEDVLSIPAGYILSNTYMEQVGAYNATSPASKSTENVQTPADPNQSTNPKSDDKINKKDNSRK